MSVSTIGLPLACAGTGTAYSWTGSAGVSFTSAFGRAVNWWLGQGTSVRLTGAVIGLMGTGQVTGKLIISPATGAYMSFLSAFSITGIQAQTLASICSLGVVAGASTTGLYKGDSIGVATGVDVGKVTLADPTTLAGRIIVEWGSGQIYGVCMTSLASALASGASVQTLTGIGIGAVTPKGPVAPWPGGGASTSTVL